MTLIGLGFLLFWAWKKWGPPPPPPPPPAPATWIFSYKGDRNAPMEFLVYAKTESEALIKYMKAGLDPKRITGSCALPTQ